MLSKQPWIHFEEDMTTFWQQAMDEGRAVADYEEACRSVKRGEILKGETLLEKMDKMPLVPDYPFHEPSKLPQIHAARPENRPSLSSIPDPAVLKDKLAGAWLGRIAGCLLGKPIEGIKRAELTFLLENSHNMPLSRYMDRRDFNEAAVEAATKIGRLDNCWGDNLSCAAPIDDDTNYTVLALRIVQKYGRDFTSNDVLESWLMWMPMLATCTAERVAYRNAAMGLTAPETATFHNPYREWIGAQIRGDFFGYINPGNPMMAAEMAFRDAAISHVKNGIYGEMFVAAMLAAAAVSEDVGTVLEAGLAEIPEKCRLRRDVELVRGWHKAGMSVQAATDQIHSIYDEYNGHHWCHTNSNAMIVTLGLLYGEKDFSRSICIAVEACFDTDCNGATVGSILGMMLGKTRVPARWITPFRGTLLTSIADYENVLVEKLVADTLECV